MLLLSIGENCMPGLVFRRFGVENTWSTPFTHARTNICYAIRCEQEAYADLLNKDYIMKNPGSSPPGLYRNIKYINDEERKLFENSVSCGFEFTHHDIINNTDAFESYKRKIQRMIELRSSDEKILFFYHHRYVIEEDIEKIINYCNQFVQLYENEKRQCHIVLMKQRIVKDRKERHIAITEHGCCIVCELYTTRIWEGKKPGFVSGERDDDLIYQMFKKLYAMRILDDISFLNDSPVRYNYKIDNDVDGLENLIMDRLSINDGEHLYIWGAGNRGVPLADYLAKRKVPLAAIIDNDVKKQHNLHLVVPVVPFSSIQDETNAKIFISVLDKGVISKIKAQIEETQRNVKVMTFEDIKYD